MTTRAIATIKRFTGTQFDIKPTGVPVGSTFFEYDSKRTWITYDGENWVNTAENTLSKAPIMSEFSLYADYDVDNQSFHDGQVLGEDEGVRKGQDTAVIKDGTLAVVSGKLAFTAQSTQLWGDLGLYSQAYARSLGRSLFFTINRGETTGDGTMVGWSDAATAQITDGMYQLHFNSTPGIFLRVNNGAVETPKLAVYSASTDYRIALVLGGYNSNKVPWKIGDDPSLFPYGVGVFIEGGAFAGYTLLWRSALENAATLYAILTNGNSTGTLDNRLVPDYDFSAVLQPLFLYTFGDATGTDLTTVTPDVDDSGNGFTARVGTWKTDTGKGELSIAGVNPANNGNSRVLTFDDGEPDAEYEQDAKYDSSSIENRNGIVVRGSAETSNGLNLWVYWLRGSGNEELYEIADGAVTQRASAASGAVNGTTYKLKAIANGSTITCYRDGVQKLQYTSATFNQTATRKGIYADARSLTDKAFDNIAVWPRVDAKYDHEFTKGTGSKY